MQGEEILSIPKMQDIKIIKSQTNHVTFGVLFIIALLHGILVDDDYTYLRNIAIFYRHIKRTHKAPTRIFGIESSGNGGGTAGVLKEYPSLDRGFLVHRGEEACGR